MDLTQRLRQRSEQIKATAQVDCGGLGTLTVQALPLREGQAIANGPDGHRALLYAACRQLQSAGEQLRREGRLFRPDEIMLLVSDEEALAGAAVVRRLSGLDPSHGQAQQPADETERKERDTVPQPTAQPEMEPVPSGPASEQGTAHTDPQQDSKFPENTKKERQSDKIRPPFVHPTHTDPPEEKTAKVRLEPVQNFGKQSSETRQNVDPEAEVGQVSRESEKEKDAPQDGAVGPDIQKDPTQISPIYGAEMVTQTTKKGEVQRDKREIIPQIKPKSAPPEKEPAEKRTAEPQPPKKEGLHETKSESGEEVHEIKSEFPPRTGEGLHEIKSERGAELHEIKSEFFHPVEVRPARFQTGTEDGVRPLNPVTEDLAREVARVLVEGLRRAAGAR